MEIQGMIHIAWNIYWFVDW